jgi:hypothetical protein
MQSMHLFDFVGISLRKTALVLQLVLQRDAALGGPARTFTNKDSRDAGSPG